MDSDGHGVCDAGTENDDAAFEAYMDGQHDGDVGGSERHEGEGDDTRNDDAAFEVYMDGQHDGDVGGSECLAGDNSAHKANDRGSDDDDVVCEAHQAGGDVANQGDRSSSSPELQEAHSAVGPAGGPLHQSPDLFKELLPVPSLNVN